MHREIAHSYSERLRAHAAAGAAAGRMEAARSKRLRDLSDLCESYARSFARWSQVDVPVADKIRERQAFSLVMQAVDVELGET